MGLLVEHTVEAARPDCVVCCLQVAVSPCVVSVSLCLASVVLSYRVMSSLVLPCSDLLCLMFCLSHHQSCLALFSSRLFLSCFVFLVLLVVCCHCIVVFSRLVVCCLLIVFVIVLSSSLSWSWSWVLGLGLGLSLCFLSYLCFCRVFISVLCLCKGKIALFYVARWKRGFTL